MQEKDLQHAATLTLFDLRGRPVAVRQLEPGFSEEKISLEHVPPGILVYQLSDGRRQFLGKLFLH